MQTVYTARLLTGHALVLHLEVVGALSTGGQHDPALLHPLEGQAAGRVAHAPVTLLLLQGAVALLEAARPLRAVPVERLNDPHHRAGAAVDVDGLVAAVVARRQGVP